MTSIKFRIRENYISLLDIGIDKFNMKMMVDRTIDMLESSNNEDLYDFLIHDLFFVFVPLVLISNEEQRIRLHSIFVLRFAKAIYRNELNIADIDIYELIENMHITKYVLENYKTYNTLISKIDAKENSIYGILNNIILESGIKLAIPQKSYMDKYMPDSHPSYSDEEITNAANKIDEFVSDKLSGIDKLKAYAYMHIGLDLNMAVKYVIGLRIPTVDTKDLEVNMMKRMTNILETADGMHLVNLMLTDNTSAEATALKNRVLEFYETYGVIDGCELMINENITNDIVDNITTFNDDIANGYDIEYMNKFSEAIDIISERYPNRIIRENKLICDIVNENNNTIGTLAMGIDNSFRYVGLNIREEFSDPTRVHELIKPIKEYYLFEAGNSGNSAIRKVSRKFKKVDNKVSAKLDRTIGDLVSDIKSFFRAGDNRAEIITDKMPKPSKLLKLTIGNILMIGINPALGALTSIATYALHKNCKRKERGKILQELKQELEIVKEKIEDAKSNGDNDARYKLIRIRQQMEKDIERIRYKHMRDI